MSMSGCVHWALGLGLCAMCSAKSDHAPPRRAPCPYLTTFHGAYTSDDSTSVTLILELMDGGELQEFVSDGACKQRPGLAKACRKTILHCFFFFFFFAFFCFFSVFVARHFHISAFCEFHSVVVAAAAAAAAAAADDRFAVCANY